MAGSTDSTDPMSIKSRTGDADQGQRPAGQDFQTTSESAKTTQPTGSPEKGQDGEPSNYPSRWKFALITIALCLAVFCMALDNTIIATAIPRITDQFHNLNDVGWYASAYLLTSCSFQLLFGKLYTFYSIKWVYLGAITIFELGSIICGAAPTSTALIIGRAIAGAGSAGIFSGSVLIIAHGVSLRKRPLYTGLVAAMFGIASVSGPLLGGVFTDKLTWRWCFYINLPFGAITVLFIIFFFTLPGKKRARELSWKEKIVQFDIEGTICFLPGVVSVLLALQWGGTIYAWSNWRIILLFVVFGVLMLGFLGVQWWKKENATVPPRVFLDRTVWGSAAFSVCFGASFFLMMYYVPIWFQAIQGVSAVQSGIRNLPMVLSMVVSSICAGGMVSYIGYYKPFIYASIVLLSIGAGLLTTLEVDSGTGQWVGYQFLYGFGAGLGMQQPVIAIQATLPLADIPIATSIFMFAQTLGGAVFVSVAQNIFTNQLVNNLSGIAGLDPGLVLRLGATQFRQIIPPQLLPEALVAYNTAIRQAWYVSVAAGAATIIGALAIKWGSVKGKMGSPAVA